MRNVRIIRWIAAAFLLAGIGIGLFLPITTNSYFSAVRTQLNCGTAWGTPDLQPSQENAALRPQFTQELADEWNRSWSACYRVHDEAQRLPQILIGVGVVAFSLSFLIKHKPASPQQQHRVSAHPGTVV